MKLLNRNKQEIKVRIENLDDLWYLSNIIDIGDFVRGKTQRKIKIGEKEDRNIKVIKKSVFIELQAEKIEFSKTSNALRVLGAITQGPDEVQKGLHHSFSLEMNSVITIKKERWLKYQLDRLKEASSAKISRILIVVHDREEAFFALMKKYGYELLSHIQGNVKKKVDENKVSKNFYVDIINKMEAYAEKYKIDKIIVASPAFWKEDLMKEVKKDDLRKKVLLASCSSTGETAINEVLKRDEVRRALHEDRITKEINMIEDLLTEIKKNNLAVYGMRDSEKAAETGAVKELMVLDSLIKTLREEGEYPRLEAIMKNVEATKGNVNIISSEHDGGKKLSGLGGVGAILRYKLNY